MSVPVPNLEIRNRIRHNWLRGYEVAGRMEISTSWFYQLLQRPLDPEWEKRFNDAIDALLKEREEQLASQ